MQQVQAVRVDVEEVVGSQIMKWAPECVLEVAVRLQRPLPQCVPAEIVVWCSWAIRRPTEIATLYSIEVREAQVIASEFQIAAYEK